MRLAPGSYYLVVDREVHRGGLSVGILDDALNSWQVVHNYWEGQTLAGKRTAVPLLIEEPRRVTPILSTWAPAGVSAAWVLRRITIVRVSQRLELATGHATTREVPR